MGTVKYLGLLLGLFFVFSSGKLYAQQSSKTKEPVYIMPDVKPEFPNGNAGIQAYFAKRIDTRKGSKKEIVTVSLVVTKTGTVKQVYIGRGISPETDSAVAKIARTMVGWKPGKVKGETVNARVLFPVVFSPEVAAEPTRPVTQKTEPELSGLENEDRVVKEEVAESRQIYTFVEQMPEFPGGETALQAFMKKNLIYPEADKKNGTRGLVVLQFVVEKSGALTEITNLKSLSAAADKEALRVLKLMPSWTPGKQNGKIVAVRMVLGIRFPPSE